MDIDGYGGCDVDQEGGFRSSETDLLIATPLDLEIQERLLLWKLDLRILPILCLLYLFACEFHRSVFLS
jgi:hypothetical protein